MNLDKLNYLTELLTNLISLNTVIVLCLIFTFYFDRQKTLLCCYDHVTWNWTQFNNAIQTMQYKADNFV